MIKRLLFAFVVGALSIQTIYADDIHITDFINAAEGGELFKVKSLVSRNVLNFGGEYNQWAVDRALQGATTNGHLAVVKYLVEYIGVDINYHSKYDNPILLEATDKGHLAIVQYLVSKGANVNAKGKCGYPPLYDSANDAIWDYLKPKTTGFNISLAFINAARRGNLEQVKSFLAQLKQEGKDMNDTIDDIIEPCFNKSALSEAGKYGHLSVVKYLIENNDWDLNEVKGWWGNYNNLPLEIRQKLPQYGTFYNNAGFALENAAKYGHLDIVKYLAIGGARMGCEDLREAAEGGYLEIVKFLVSQGVDVNDENCKNSSPLQSAAEERHLEIVKFLVENGADTSFALIGVANKFCYEKTTNYYTDFVEIMKFLLQNNANANIKGYGGETALMIVAKCSKYSISDRFAYLRLFEAVKLLVENGANINIQDNDGRTALMIIADGAGANTEIIQYLLQHGANVNLIDNDGETALDKAIRGGTPFTILQKYGAKSNKNHKSPNTQRSAPKAPPNIHIRNHKSDSPRNAPKFPPNVNIRIVD